MEPQKLFSFFYNETAKEKKFRHAILANNEKIIFFGLLASIISNGLLIILETVQIINDIEGHNYARVITIVIEEVFSAIMLVYYPKHHKKLIFSNLLSLLYSIDFVVFFIISFYDQNSVLISFNFYYFRMFLLNGFTGHLNSKLLYFDILCLLL